MRALLVTIGAIVSLIDGYRILTHQKEWDLNKYARRHGIIVTDIEKLKKVSGITRIFWAIVLIALVIIMTLDNYIDMNIVKWIWIWLTTVLVGQSISAAKSIKYMAWEESWDNY